MTRTMFLDVCLHYLGDSNCMAPKEGAHHVDLDFDHLLFFRTRVWNYVCDIRHSYLKVHDSDHCAALRRSGPVSSQGPMIFEDVDLL